MTKETSTSSALLLSIRQEHALRIFNSSKRYEFEKSVAKGKIQEGIFVRNWRHWGCWVFRGGWRVKPVSELWDTVGLAATTQERFLAYFSKAKEGYAIEIRNPLRFDTAVSAKQLNGDFTKLVPPQSFLVLDPGQPLYTVLEAEESSHAPGHRPPRVTLKPILRDQHATYRKLVYRNISPHYQDIDDTFADANLRIHEKGSDSAGFFLIRKEVLSIYNDRGRCIGFTTLTFKSSTYSEIQAEQLFIQAV